MKTAGMFGMLGVKTSNADHSLRNTTDILLDLSDKLKGKDKGFQQFVGRQFGIDEATLRVLSQGREATLKLVNAQKQLYNEKTAREAEKQREKLIDFERALDKLKIQIAEKHVIIKAETSLVEAKNSSLRGNLARLNRRTKRFNKSIEMLNFT
jgi:hypothetical protein